ncbi:MAG TPA: histidine kinase [Candidatus Dormibacteraeota bacterium]|nr:histidine kinase [Candidatus Dormibacteraeota bacterium]
MDALPAGEVSSAADLATLLTAEAAALRDEVGEIELLINQARTESSRHEARRKAAEEKLGIAAERLGSGGNITPKEVTELANQLVAVARRAALMEAQVDLLEGKRKSAARLHEAIVTHAAQARALAGLPDKGGKRGAGTNAMPGDDAPIDEAAPMPPGVSRMILTAQEDLRREIARQMHDGPAQSLTNIVLQAQIVDRLMTMAPDKAPAEVGQLIAMVQRTLDATKTFIFDIRPMVLDDLGLVPTLRRASRDRGSRVGVTVDFESVGVDRRLPAELESGLFRMLDDALAAHVARKPDRLSLHLDWGEHLDVELTAGKNPVAVPDPELPPEGAELPPALAEMVGERRRTYQEALEAARIASLSRLPDQAWRDISARARILGVTAEMLDDGARLHLIVELAPAEAAAALAAGEATPA